MLDITHARWSAIRKRWFDMLILGVLAALIWLGAERVVHPMALAAILYLEHTWQFAPIVIVLAGILTVTISCGWKRWAALLGLRHFWTYPPLLVSVGTALLIHALFAQLGATNSAGQVSRNILISAYNHPVLALVAILLLIATTVFFPFKNLRRRRAGAMFSVPTHPSPSIEALGNADGNKLVKWFLDDNEPSSWDQDYFGHSLVASRIADRLLASSHIVCPAVAVVGPQGSGKSTIGKFVELQLAGRPDWCVVRMSLWPFESCEAAVEAILGAIIKNVGDHVSILGLRGLPQQYLAAIESLGGLVSTLTALVRPKSQPLDILNTVSDTLVAIDLHLVLWIEDLDRFCGGRENERRADNIAPLHSLLHQLQHVAYIAVVISDTTLESAIDIGKLARYIERPPRISTALAWRLLCNFRDYCLGGNPHAIIDPRSPEVIGEFSFPKTAMQLEFRLVASSSPTDDPSPVVALAMLFSNPRHMKHALRVAYESWTALCGEFDFDDLLILSALRTVQPTIFSYIEASSTVLQDGFSSIRDRIHETKAAEHPTLIKLRELIDLSPEMTIRRALTSLLGELFPATRQGDPDANWRIYDQKPQGVASRRHGDYFTRYLTLTCPPARTSDQETLCAMKRWDGNEDSDLVARAMDEESSERVRALGFYLKPKGKTRLLREVARALANTEARAWLDGLRSPSITMLWNMMLVWPPPHDELQGVLTELLDLLVRHNLPLVYSLVDAFTSTTPHTRLLSPDATRDIKRALITYLQRDFPSGRGRALDRALRGASPRLMWNLARLVVSEPPIPGPDWNRFNGWDDFGKVVLEAATINPTSWIPQLLPFICAIEGPRAEIDQSGPEGPSRRLFYDAVFAEGQARAVFDFDLLMQLIAVTDIDIGGDEILAPARDSAKAAAMLYMSKTVSKP
jgi:hypothetical protein